MKSIDDIKTAGFKNYNLITFSWYVTDYCNYRCTYCAEACRLSNTKTQCAQEIAAHKMVLKRICNRNVGDFSVELIGGEPTMAAHLPSILNELDLTSNCKYYELITNLSKPIKYFEDIVTNRHKKFHLKPSFHPEYYKEHFIQKILELSELCNLRPTIMLHDNPIHFQKTINILDTIIENNIEYDLQTIYKTKNYSPDYGEEFNKIFGKYIKHYAKASREYNIDFYHNDITSDVPYSTSNTDFNVNVNDIKQRNLHQFNGFKCKALYWEIEPSGRIYNSCTREDLQYNYNNIRKTVTCPVVDGCVEKHKLFYHKTNE